MLGRDDKKGGEVVGFIGKGMSVEGKLVFDKTTVRLEGTFKGEISGKGMLVIGEEGKVDAQVTVESAIITGEVKGSIEAASRVEIKSPGKVMGEVKTPTLIIGEGALFEGTSVMLRKDKTTIPFETAVGADAPGRH